MSANRALLLGPVSAMSTLATALRGYGIETSLAPEAAADDATAEAWATSRLADLRSHSVAVLWPAEGDDLQSDHELLRGLCCAFALVKVALGAWGAEMDGRIILLVPGNAAMGDPSRPILSTYAGALLSLSRTSALEARKGRCTVNVLMHDEWNEAVAEALAAQVFALSRPAAQALNGQEIYAMGGRDVGRLHP
jgi:hypothetical protein